MPHFQLLILLLSLYLTKKSTDVRKTVEAGLYFPLPAVIILRVDFRLTFYLFPFFIGPLKTNQETGNWQFYCNLAIFFEAKLSL